MGEIEMLKSRPYFFKFGALLHLIGHQNPG